MAVSSVDPNYRIRRREALIRASRLVGRSELPDPATRSFGGDRRGRPSIFPVAGADDPYEWHRVSLPKHSSADQVRLALSVAASYGGWELRRYRSWPDGRRVVDLRRRPSPDPPVGLPQLTL
jgi:hypothetical protein